MMVRPGSQQEALTRAVERFNAGDWRGAVDEWEAGYHEVEGLARKPWLGLIRVTAALHYLASGKPLSARRAWVSGRALLVEIGPAWGGIDLPRLLAELAPVLSPLEDPAGTPVGASVPADPPRIRSAVR